MGAVSKETLESFLDYAKGKGKKGTQALWQRLANDFFREQPEFYGWWYESSEKRGQELYWLSCLWALLKAQQEAEELDQVDNVLE